MWKNSMMVMGLMITGSAFWIPVKTDAQTLSFKCPSGTTYNLTTKTCKASTGSVDTEGDGNTQGGKTTVNVAILPDNEAGIFLLCRNRGGTIGSGKAFLPGAINLSSVKGTKPTLVDKKGKFVWTNQDIQVAGVHPEFTPEQCANDPTGQCQALQVFCPNGGFNGNDGKNWVPVDAVPVAMKMQGFLHFCDNDGGIHVCNCDPTSGPANRCASATKVNPGPQDFTYVWTDISGPNGIPDGAINHFDIRPFYKTPVNACFLPNPQDFSFNGPRLGYACEDTTLPSIFP
jgi:hypothetical protein